MFDCSPFIEHKLIGHRGSITAVDFSPTGKQMASSSYDNTVLVWDLKDEIKSYRYRGHDDVVYDISYSHSGNYLATASRDHTVRLWVANIGGNVGVVNAHSGAVKSVHFHPDSLQFVTAGDDGWLKIWTVNQQCATYENHAHKNLINCARFSNDGNIISTSSNDSTVKLWTSNSTNNIHTYTIDDVGLHLSWHPIGYLVAVATTNGKVLLYDIRTHKILQHYTIHENVINKISFHPSGNYLITAGNDSTIKVIDLKKGYRIFTLSDHHSSVNAVVFSPSGNNFVSGGEDKTLFLWKTNFVLKLPYNVQNQSFISTSRMSSPRARTSLWKQCYHNTRLPLVTFRNQEIECNKQSGEYNISFDCPTAISTPRLAMQNASTSMTPDRDRYDRTTHNSERHSNELPPIDIDDPQNPNSLSEANPYDACGSVGDMSHIPRCPPSPQSCNIPSIVACDKEELCGMISLKENDVCYTSGTIEWVGKKHNLPMAGGFKVLHDRTCDVTNEPRLKRFKNTDAEPPCSADKTRSCDCVDVLPTVNAIIDHLNALHEAVDIVDIRLNTVENNLVKNSNR